MRLLSFIRRSAPVAVLVVTGSGCSSSTGPSSVAGTYVLRSIAGDALPAVAVTGVYIEGPPIVLADTIRFRGDGAGTRAITSRGGGIGDGQPGRVSHDVLPLRVHVRGGQLDLFYDCGPNANCIGIGPAHLTATGFEIAATDDARGPQVYRRISRSP
jgi:hypothetical protein